MDTNALILRRRGKITNVIFTMDNLPKFVNINGGSALRLKGKNTYYRDGGCWDIGVKIIDGKLISTSYMGGINNKELTPITEAEWRKCNGEYAPKDI
jgi:hypothetical protein